MSDQLPTTYQALRSTLKHTRRDKLELIVDEIYCILFPLNSFAGDLDMDNEWDASTVDRIACVMETHLTYES